MLGLLAVVVRAVVIIGVVVAVAVVVGVVVVVAALLQSQSGMKTQSPSAQ